MSHDTHHGHSTENKSIISFKNSFWLVAILVGLFIAALNFVQVESKPEAEEHHGHEMKHEGAHQAASHEAAAHEEAVPAPAAAEHAPAAEEAHQEQPAQH